ncbi:hypothetical protein [Parafrankia discariae]|uniref:hypothetical protein n=1 Tax=Parafrankia discariae TaxID=365528 RepID=UPI0003A45741|nr:hypothetical protein [Parafrankia discariae]
MGSDGKAAHQTYVVSPTLDESAVGTADLLDVAALDITVPDDGEVASAGVQDILAAAKEIAAGEPATDEDLAAQYALFAAAIHAAQEHAAAEEAAGANLDQAQADIKAVAADYLNGLTDAQLQTLAALHGFEHPALVGLNSTTSPLAYWLNPAYPDDLPSKMAIAAKAQERYAELAAGGTVAGMTLADLQALEATSAAPGATPTGAGSWSATPEQVDAARAALTDAVATFTSADEDTAPTAFAAMIDAENRLATAACPEMGEHLAIAQAAASHHVSQAIDGALTSANGSDLAGPLVAQAHADGRLTDAEATVLEPAQQLALLRVSTSAELQATTHEAATHRAGQLAEAQQLHAKINKYAPLKGADGLYLGADPGEIVDFAQAANRMYVLNEDIASWKDHAHGAGKGLLATHTAETAATASASTLTSEFTEWQKSVPVETLQAAAGELGLQHAETASRMHARSYITAHIAEYAGGDLAKDLIQAKVAFAPASPSPTATPPAAAAASAAPLPPSSLPAASALSAPPSPGSFKAKQQALVEALKHHQASHGAIPARHPDADVAGWVWTPGPHLALGGAHSKTVYTAPDGGQWMFKPDSTGGARAAAEAEASQVLHAAGLPTVPVHRATIGSRAGAVQPLLPGATTFSANPKSWSQADVDAIVRTHVGSWAIGDHDGKPDNYLRTAGGGLVPVDRGQAFKFFGQDRLATDYHPNAAFGDLVSSQAYRAAKKNTLAAGVRIRPEAALPTIKAFEAIPDSQYRAMLHRTAHEGAARGAYWAGPMRERAAARLKVPAAAVTPGQVAAEFLDEAVGRKQRLRADFADFFAAEGIPGAHVLRHG